MESGNNSALELTRKLQRASWEYIRLERKRFGAVDAAEDVGMVVAEHIPPVICVRDFRCEPREGANVGRSNPAPFAEEKNAKDAAPSDNEHQSPNSKIRTLQKPKSAAPWNSNSKPGPTVFRHAALRFNR